MSFPGIRGRWLPLALCGDWRSGLTCGVAAGLHLMKDSFF
jgi:hypothetical protein